MSLHKYTFTKGERLCSKKIIDAIFSRQQTQLAFSFPLSVIWRFQPLPANFPAQVLFVVPKKKLKKSHDRNRVKRQLREIYRLNKNILYNFLNSQRLQCAVVIVYNSQELLPYDQLEKAYMAALEKIVTGRPPAAA